MSKFLAFAPSPTQFQLLESVVINANDAVVITEAEPINLPGPRIVYVNPAFTRMTGYHPNEILGQTPRLLQGPKTDRATLDRLRHALENWQPITVELLNYRKDRSEFWVENSITPVADETGCYTHWIAIQRDITERKWVEARLRLLESVVVNAKDAILVTEANQIDLPGPRIIYVNEAFTQLTGYSPDEIIGQTPRLLQGPKTDRAVLSQLRSALKSWRSITVELLNYNKDGTEFWVENSVTPVKNSEGRYTHWIAIQRDITERKQVEAVLQQRTQELARSNAELEQFAQIASHDLQEPLRKIQAFGDYLWAECNQSLSSEGQDYLTRMLNAASRMQALILDLLTYAKVSSQGHSFKAVNLTVIAQEVLSDLEVRIDEVGAQVQVNPLPTLEADPTQMRQLLQNLIGNALKFHKPALTPIVTVTGECNDTWCQIKVADNGIGFDVKYCDRIFNMFQRLHGRGEYEGTGTGLAICRKITERHGGSITAASTPGLGASFTVTLPVRQPQESPKHAP
jgi:PAS domain S-box-containing protein